MTLWYALCDALGAEFLSMNFMKNALLAVIVMAPLFGLLSTMIVTGKMSFFSDALGHSGFTGIAIGVLCGAALLTVCDVAARTLFAPFEIPVGICMALIGGPFFIYLILRSRKGEVDGRS